MTNLIEYVDEDGTVLHGIPVVIIADRSGLSVSGGSKTRFIDTDHRVINATPLIVLEDYREPGSGGGGGTGGGSGGYSDNVLDGGSF